MLELRAWRIYHRVTSLWYSGQRAGRGSFLLVPAKASHSPTVQVPLLPGLGEEAAAAAVGAPLLCPVGPQGDFLAGRGSHPFKGLQALGKGEVAILSFLRRNNALLLSVWLPNLCI